MHKKQWTSLFFGIGIADGVQGTAVDPSRNVGCPNFVTQACLSKAQLETLGYPDQSTLDFARHASVTSYLGAVKAPTLIVQDQKDSPSTCRRRPRPTADCRPSARRSR